MHRDKLSREQRGDKGGLIYHAVKRYQSERILGIGLALLACCLYCWTLCPSVFPGNSALASVSVLRAWPGHEMVGHPIWNISARLFCLLPLGDIPYRLNMFSALCGAGVVFFLFRLVTLILYDVMSEERWIRQIDDDRRPDDLSNSVSRGVVDAVETINDAGHRIAMAGGAASALAFTFCTPFWIASTSLHPQTFELLMLMGIGYIIVRYFAASCVLCLIMATFLLGMGVIESVACLMIIPVAVYYIVYGGCRHGHISTSFMALLFLCFAAGALLAGIAQVVWITHGGVSTSVLIRIASMWFHSHVDGLRSVFVHKGWLVMLAQGLLPLLIVYAGRQRFINTHFMNPPVYSYKENAYQNFREQQMLVSDLSWAMVLFLLLGCVAHALLNLPGSPWYFSHDSAYLPVMPLLGIAVTFGFLFSYGLIFGYRDRSTHAKIPEEALPRTSFRMTRVVSVAMILGTCSLVVASVFLNKGEIEGQKACFVDVFCRNILEAAPEARCFVTDGTFDMNLLVQARMFKRSITLLNLRDSNRLMTSVSGGDRTKKQTESDFLRGWLSAHPASCSQVAMLTAAGVWLEAGFQAIPSTLVYLGAKPGAQTDLASLVKEQRACWQKMEPMIKENHPHLPLLQYLQSEVRNHASRLANDLGVLCLHSKAKEEAQEAIALALTIAPDNVCAWVNQCTPDRITEQKKKDKDCIVLLEGIASLLSARYALGSLSEYEKRYGALYLPAVEHLANVCNEGSVDEYSAKRSPMLQLSREYVLAVIQSQAEPRGSSLTDKDGVMDEEVLKVIDAMAGGYSKAAENQLRTLLRKRRASLISWSLLAEALMNQGNFAEVQNTVLPEMRFIAESKGSEWIDMTEGCLALRQSKPDYRLAHDRFLQVLKRKPDIEEVQNMLIQAALSLGDQALVEADCKVVLAHSPRQPMANAALGALLLNQNRLEDAEKALNISIASRFSAMALNDLGETLRRMQRFHAAEGVTRRALLLQPDFYQAWDTLAVILAEQKRVEEAAEAHRRALRLCQTDIRLYLTAAKFEQTRGDFNAARKLLQQSAPLLSQTSTVCKETYNELLNSLPR